MDYYKVVRADYTDCYSGSVRYGVGETVRHPNPASPRQDIRCKDAYGPGGLHACHRATDTLQYRREHWPVRLLRVTVAAEDLLADDGHKVQAVALTVAEELPLAAAFGPNGAAVAAFIADLPGWPWFRPDRTRDAEVAEAAAEYQRRLAAFGWTPLPVEVRVMTLVTASRTGAKDASGIAVTTVKDVASAFIYAFIYANARAASAAARSAASAAARSAARDATRSATRYASDSASMDSVWDSAWDAYLNAAWLVVADLMQQPNPFEPLMAIWQAGFYPVGAVDGTFVIADCEGSV